MNLRALQDFFSKNCIFLDTILFFCFAQVRHCIFVSFFLYNIAQYNIAQYFLWQMKPFPWMFSRVDGAYYGKILICAPMSCQRRGLLRQNPYLCPDILPATGLITVKSLSVPRCTKVEGIIDLILSHIPAFASSAGYR